MTSTPYWSMIVRPAIVFLLCVYFTRASRQRILSSVAGGTIFMLGNILVDLCGHRQGWWWYPGMGDRGYAPLAWYAGAGIGFAGIGLIGWRIHRRFGWRGLAIFVAGFSIFGVLRDWVVSTTIRKGVIVFGSGITPWAADYLAWFLLAAVAMAVQTAIMGDPRSDALVRGA
jgi:hypothetical protein